METIKKYLRTVKSSLPGRSHGSNEGQENQKSFQKKRNRWKKISCVDYMFRLTFCNNSIILVLIFKILVHNRCCIIFIDVSIGFNISG